MLRGAWCPWEHKESDMAEKLMLSMNMVNLLNLPRYSLIYSVDFCPFLHRYHAQFSLNVLFVFIVCWKKWDFFFLTSVSIACF